VACATALAVVSLTAADSGPARPFQGEALARAVRRIQNVCFATYPPDMVRRMTGIEGPVPQAIRDDPALQFKAFHAEDRRAKGLFYPSDLSDILPALAVEVHPGDRVLDLGSGDGRVVFLAALLGAEATGIEWDKEIHGLALRAREDLADLLPRERIHLRHGDFLKEPLERYDVLFYFDSGTFARSALFDKIGAEMRHGARLLLAHENLEPLGFVKSAQHGVVDVYTLPPPPP
jgi:SAM-dependent methyltransferase